ncbi:MAG: elongation factor P [bacterium]
MITPNEFRAGSLIRYRDGIYEVLSYQRSRTAQRRARVQARIRNIDTGAQIDESFESELKLEEADLERRKSQFMYADDVGYHFMDLVTYDQFALPVDVIGDKKYYLTDNCEVEVVYIDGAPRTFQVPIFVVLEITETVPDYKGDTASGGGKPATTATGLVVTVPFFVKVGDRIKVDTRENSYVERA